MDKELKQYVDSVITDRRVVCTNLVTAAQTSDQTWIVTSFRIDRDNGETDWRQYLSAPTDRTIAVYKNGHQEALCAMMRSLVEHIESKLSEGEMEAEI
jgi:hypothetical protein